MKSTQKGADGVAVKRFGVAMPALFPHSPLSTAGIAVSCDSDAVTARFWYYVVPGIDGAAWRVMFEGQSQVYPYDSRSEAIKAACRAADAMHRKLHTPAGVRVRVGDDWREAVRFGARPGEEDRHN